MKMSELKRPELEIRSPGKIVSRSRDDLKGFVFTEFVIDYEDIDRKICEMGDGGEVKEVVVVLKRRPGDLVYGIPVRYEVED